MAVSVLNGWSAPVDADPSGSLTIGAGAGERLLVVCQTAENNGQVTVSTMTVGGVAATGTVSVFNDEGTSDQHIWFWWWDEAAIDAMTGTAVSYVDDEVVNKHNWSYAVYDGVNQSSPVTSDPQTAESSNTLTLNTTSNINDYIVVAVSRASQNRDVTDWDTLTEQWTDDDDLYWTGLAHGVGGDNSTLLTGDGTADDFNAISLVISASGAVAKADTDSGTFTATELEPTEFAFEVFDIGVFDAFEDPIKGIADGISDSGSFSSTETASLDTNLVFKSSSDSGDIFSPTGDPPGENGWLVQIGTDIKTGSDIVSNFSATETNAALDKLNPLETKGPVTDSASSFSATEAAAVVQVDVVVSSSDAGIFAAEEDLFLFAADTIVLQRSETYTFTAIEDAFRSEDIFAIDGDFNNWTAVETAQPLVKIDYDPGWEEDDVPWGGVELGASDFVPVFLDGQGFYLLARSTDQYLDAWVERRAAVFEEGRPILGRGVYPQITGPVGQVVKISLGGQEEPDGAVDWEGPYDFVIGEDIYVDFAVTGRYLAVRFESEGIPTWQLQSYDIDYEVVGVY